MDITHKEHKAIERALANWENKGDLSAEKKQQLLKTLTIRPFDWKRLSRYCFWMAIACALIAVITLFSDRWLIAYLINLFSNILSLDFVRIFLPTLLALACYAYGFYRQRSETQWHYSTEAIIFLGVIFTAIALWQLGIALDNGKGHVASLFLLGCAIYGAIGFFARSGMVWLFFLLSLANWFGAETGYASGWGAYWLGMGYPIRFVCFGSVLLGLCFAARPLLQQRQLYTVSKAMGLTYLFIALWILSIFGNYDINRWSSTAQLQLLPWALLFLTVSIICIFISLKTDDGMLRGFGLTFLGINLYTRFFEYFWNSMYKAIFFLILAVSFAIIGRYAERIWHTQIGKE